jgi:hypothetical protein
LSFQAPRWGRLEFLVDQSAGNTNTFSHTVWGNAGTSPNIYERARLSPSAIELRDYAPGSTLIGQDNYSRPAANVWLHFSTDPRYGLEYAVKDAANSGTLRSFARPAPGASGGIGGPAASGNWWSFGFQDSSQPQVAKFMKVRLDDGQGGGAVPAITAASSQATGRTTASITLTVPASAVGGETWYLTTPTNTIPSDFDAMVAPLSNFQVITTAGVQVIPLSGLQADTQHYCWVLVRGPQRDRTSITPAGNFRTEAALAPPALSTVAAKARGDTVTVTVTPAGGSGPIAGVQVTLPAHATPDGAVARGPVAASLVGGVYVAVIQGVAVGHYGFASATATGTEGGTDTKVETKTLRILSLTGVAQA